MVWTKWQEKQPNTALPNRGRPHLLPFFTFGFSFSAFFFFLTHGLNDNVLTSTRPNTSSSNHHSPFTTLLSQIILWPILTTLSMISFQLLNDVSTICFMSSIHNFDNSFTSNPNLKFKALNPNPVWNSRFDLSLKFEFQIKKKS